MKAELVEAGDLTGEEALRRGMIPVPPEMVAALQAMTEEERLAWAREQVVRTQKAGGVELVQPVGPLITRGLEARKAKNAAKRERRARRERRGR